MKGKGMIEGRLTVDRIVGGRVERRRGVQATREGGRDD